MEKLDFDLPDFVRFAWTSDAARQMWQPRLKRIVDAWTKMEWFSTLTGIRRCAIMFVMPEHLVERSAEWTRNGLYYLPLNIHGSTHRYTARNMPPVLGESFVYRVAVGDRCDVEQLKYAYDTFDDVGIGRVLGYPACCTRAFRRHWVEERVQDSTWPAAVLSNGQITTSTNARTIRLRCPPENNILWRWMSIRAIPHLPCAFDCRDSEVIGAEFIRLGRASGYAEEMDWLTWVLKWPIEWSALHGIAEIRTPILKVSTRTDATPSKYVVQIEGSDYPTEGATGLVFPYRNCRVSGALVDITKTSVRASTCRGRSAGWYWSDNGFSSIDAMDNAHFEIVHLAATTLADYSSTVPNVLDLGCGNGVLLRRIKQVSKSAMLFGVDIRPEPLDHARDVLGEYASNCWCADMFDCEALWSADRRYSLVLIMIGRLLDESPLRVAALRNQLRSRCDRLLVYAYDDTVAALGKEFPDIIADAGLRLVSFKPGTNAGIATFWS